MNKQESKPDYYAIAVEWGEAYLAEHPESSSVRIDHLLIDDDREYVRVQILRIKFNAGREKEASFNRLRIFKNHIIKK